MYICPHCNQPGITALRRAFLGPAIPATCKSCGRKVGVPFGKSYLVALPFGLSILVAMFLPSTLEAVVAVLLGTGATFALDYLYVPLVRR